jgi:hypothetical protein
MQSLSKHARYPATITGSCGRDDGPCPAISEIGARRGRPHKASSSRDKEHRHAHADDLARARYGRSRGTGRKVSQVATARQMSGGGYLVQLSETELALIKTALEQEEWLSRFGIEVLNGADQAPDGRRPDNTRLRREIEGLALRQASLKVLRNAFATVEYGEGVA